MHEFFRTANNSHRHLKFTYEISLEQITFLDTTVYKGDRFLSSGVDPAIRQLKRALLKHCHLIPENLECWPINEIKTCKKS